MKQYGLFDIIGPRMTGPSSSHTAGAARLGGIAYQLAGCSVDRARITLYGSFATTGKGHGTDRAVAAGLLGMKPDDRRLRDSLEIAAREGKQFEVVWSDEEAAHPNTARIEMETAGGRRIDMVGASVGGGSIEVQQINGMEVSFACEYPTTLIFHQDLPGMITKVTSVFARAGINIAFMRVFRSSKRQTACMVIETDEQPNDRVLEEIRAIGPGIQEVYRFEVFF